MAKQVGPVPHVENVVEINVADFETGSQWIQNYLALDLQSGCNEFE